jgi:hypothetical protein
MGLRSMLPLFLAIGLAGCLPYPDAIPGCQINEDLFGATYIQSASFRGDLAIIVWTDLTYGPAGGSITGATSASASATRAEYHAERDAHDGRAVKWMASTKDGKAGVVTLNGKDYRLEEGAVFLVRTAGGPARVTQVKQDLSGLKPDVVTWDRLRKENPDIKGFIAEVCGPERCGEGE